MKRRLALIATALLLAIVGTSGVMAYVNRADARAVAGVAAAKAFVAEKLITSGTTLQQAVKQGLAKRETFPKRTLPTGAVGDIADVPGAAVALSDIPPGSVLLASAFGTKPAPKALLPVPTGKMAVSVALEDSREAELVRPGSEIAIFDTYNTVVPFDGLGRLLPGNRDTVAGDGLAQNHVINHATRLLLPRVQVIAVGNDILSTSPSPSPSPSPQSTPKKTGLGPDVLSNPTVIVTVAVDQHDAEKLIQAIQTGHVYLALLTADSKSAPTAGVDDSDLFKN